jgi:hypothetical protein
VVYIKRNLFSSGAVPRAHSAAAPTPGYQRPARW